MEFLATLHLKYYAVLAAAEETQHSGIDLFLPKPAEIIWSAITIIIIAIPLIKFAIPKLMQTLDERSSEIEGKIAEADNIKNRADQTLSKYEIQLGSANSKAQEIIAASKKDAASIIQLAKIEAQHDADLITKNAMLNIQAQKVYAETELHTNISRMATDLAEKIVGESIKESKIQEKIVDDFINSLETVDFGE